MYTPVLNIIINLDVLVKLKCIVLDFLKNKKLLYILIYKKFENKILERPKIHFHKYFLHCKYKLTLYIFDSVNLAVKL